MKQPVPRASTNTHTQITVQNHIVEAVRDTYQQESASSRELSDEECIERLYWLWTELDNPVGMIQDIDPVLDEHRVSE